MGASDSEWSELRVDKEEREGNGPAGTCEKFLKASSSKRFSCEVDLNICAYRVHLPGACVDGSERVRWTRWRNGGDGGDGGDGERK